MIIGIIVDSIDLEIISVVTDDEDHCAALVDSDFFAVVVVEEGRLIVVLLVPCDVDHLAVCDVETIIDAFSGLFNTEPEICAVFSDMRPVAALNEDVGESHLLAGSAVALVIAVQSLVVEMVILIIIKCGLCDRIGACHIDLVCVYSIRILLESIDLAILRKGEVLLVIIAFTVFSLKSGLIDRVIDVLGIGIRGVLNRDTVVGNAVVCAVIGTHNAADTVDIVDIVTCKDAAGVIYRSAEVKDDGIPFQCLEDKIGADTSDISYPVKTLPVLHDAHLAAHVSFFHDLIEDVYSVQTILRLCLLVDGIHNSKGTLFEEFFVHDLAGERAARGLRLGFGLG